MKSIDEAANMGQQLRRWRAVPLLSRYLADVPLDDTWPWLQEALTTEPVLMSQVPSAAFPGVLTKVLVSLQDKSAPALEQAAADHLAQLLRRNGDEGSAADLEATLASIAAIAAHNAGTRALALVAKAAVGTAADSTCNLSDFAWLQLLAKLPSWPAVAATVLPIALDYMRQLPDAASIAPALCIVWELPQPQSSGSAASHASAAFSTRHAVLKAVVHVVSARAELCSALLTGTQPGTVVANCASAPQAQAGQATVQAAHVLQDAAAAMVQRLCNSNHTMQDAPGAAAAAVMLFAQSATADVQDVTQTLANGSTALRSELLQALQEGQTQAEGQALHDRVLLSALSVCRNAALAPALCAAVPRAALLAAVRAFAIAPAALRPALDHIAAPVATRSHEEPDIVQQLRSLPRNAKCALRAAAAAASSDAMQAALGPETPPGTPPASPPPRPLSRAGAPLLATPSAPAKLPVTTDPPMQIAVQRDVAVNVGHKRNCSASPSDPHTPGLGRDRADAMQRDAKSARAGQSALPSWVNATRSTEALQRWLVQAPLATLSLQAEHVAAAALLQDDRLHASSGHHIMAAANVTHISFAAIADVSAAAAAAAAAAASGVRANIATSLVRRVQCIASIVLAVASRVTVSAGSASNQCVLNTSMPNAAQQLASACLEGPHAAKDNLSSEHRSVVCLCALTGIAAAASHAAMSTKAQQHIWDAAADAFKTAMQAHADASAAGVTADSDQVPWAPCSLSLAEVFTLVHGDDGGGMGCDVRARTDAAAALPSPHMELDDAAAGAEDTEMTLLGEPATHSANVQVKSQAQEVPSHGASDGGVVCVAVAAGWLGGALLRLAEQMQSANAFWWLSAAQSATCDHDVSNSGSESGDESASNSTAVLWTRHAATEQHSSEWAVSSVLKTISQQQLQATEGSESEDAQQSRSMPALLKAARLPSRGQLSRACQHRLCLLLQATCAASVAAASGLPQELPVLFDVCAHSRASMRTALCTLAHVAATGMLPRMGQVQQQTGASIELLSQANIGHLLSACVKTQTRSGDIAEFVHSPNKGVNDNRASEVGMAMGELHACAAARLLGRLYLAYPEDTEQLLQGQVCFYTLSFASYARLCTVHATSVPQRLM